MRSRRRSALPDRPSTAVTVTRLFVVVARLGRRLQPTNERQRDRCASSPFASVPTAHDTVVPDAVQPVRQRARASDPAGSSSTIGDVGSARRTVVRDCEVVGRDVRPARPSAARSSSVSDRPSADRASPTTVDSLFVGHRVERARRRCSAVLLNGPVNPGIRYHSQQRPRTGRTDTQVTERTTHDHRLPRLGRLGSNRRRSRQCRTRCPSLSVSADEEFGRIRRPIVGDLAARTPTGPARDDRIGHERLGDLEIGLNARNLHRRHRRVVRRIRVESVAPVTVAVLVKSPGGCDVGKRTVI